MNSEHFTVHLYMHIDANAIVYCERGVEVYFERNKIRI